MTDVTVSALVGGIKLRVYSRGTKRSFYTFFGSSQDLINDSVSTNSQEFFTLGGLVCWYLATNSQQEDSFKFKIYFTVFLASHLVQDMHSNGNTLLSVVRLHRSLLPRFSYILD